MHCLLLRCSDFCWSHGSWQAYLAEDSLEVCPKELVTKAVDGTVDGETEDIDAQQKYDPFSTHVIARYSLQYSLETFLGNEKSRKLLQCKLRLGNCFWEPFPRNSFCFLATFWHLTQEGHFPTSSKTWISWNLLL